jgi:hypothetical protein
MRLSMSAPWRDHQARRSEVPPFAFNVSALAPYANSGPLFRVYRRPREGQGSVRVSCARSVVYMLGTESSVAAELLACLLQKADEISQLFAGLDRNQIPVCDVLYFKSRSKKSYVMLRSFVVKLWQTSPLVARLVFNFTSRSLRLDIPASRTLRLSCAFAMPMGIN